jgi:hypothetical protein
MTAPSRDSQPPSAGAGSSQPIALDTAALLQKKRVLAWRTRISIDARRTSLPESLRVMLASAAPYFGTRNDLPVFVEDADRRKAEVTIGTPTVVRDPAPPAAPKP